MEDSRLLRRAAERQSVAGQELVGALGELEWLAPTVRGQVGEGTALSARFVEEARCAASKVLRTIDVYQQMAILAGAPDPDLRPVAA